MTSDQIELAQCAKINFENFERAVPAIKVHPFYRIAKAQLDEACGDGTVEEKLNVGHEHEYWQESGLHD